MGLITNNPQPWPDSKEKSIAVSFTSPTYDEFFIYDDLLEADTVCFIARDKKAAATLAAKLRQAAMSLERLAE